MATGDLEFRLGEGATLVTDARFFSVDIVREGFRADLGQTRPGACTIVLDNKARLWDPDYASGPHFTELNTLGLKVQIRADEGGGLFRSLFVGRLDSITQGYDIGNKSATATIVAYDGLTDLATKRIRHPYRWYNETFSGITSYFQLGENVQTAEARDTTTGKIAGWAGPRKLEGSVAGNNEDSSGTSLSLANAALVLPPETTPVAPGAAYLLWVQYSGLPTVPRRVIEHSEFAGGTGSSSGAWQWGVNLDGSIVFTQHGSSGLTVSETSKPTALLDGLPHLLELDVESGNGSFVFVDGIQASIISSTNKTSTRTLPSTGNVYVGGDLFASDTTTWTIDDVSTVAVLPTVAQSNNFFWRGANGQIGAYGVFDLASARVNYILDEAGWTGARFIDAGSTELIGINGEPYALSELQITASTDSATMFTDRQGQFVYRIDSTGVLSATFSDSGAGGTIKYTDLVPQRNGNRNVNSTTITPRNGLPVTRSVAGTVVRQKSIETLHRRTDQAIDAADAINARFSTPVTVYPSITVMPERGGEWPTIMKLDIAQRVRVIRTPQGVGPAYDRFYLVEGVHHSFRAHKSTWKTTITLGPPDTVDAFILDTSVLDTGRLGY